MAHIIVMKDSQESKRCESERVRWGVFICVVIIIIIVVIIIIGSTTTFRIEL